MYLVRLIYASKVAEGVNPKDIEDILACANSHNMSTSITGVLCFNNKFFLQCLEGKRTLINNLYQKILNDPRHTNITLMDYAYIDERQFAKWSMGYVPSTQITRDLNLQYSEDDKFNPFQLTGSGAFRFLMDLRDSVENSAA